MLSFRIVDIWAGSFILTVSTLNSSFRVEFWELATKCGTICYFWLLESLLRSREVLASLICGILHATAEPDLLRLYWGVLPCCDR